MDPGEFMADESLQLDAEYYIQRVLIPPLERIFNLVGADVRQWYLDMSRPAPAAENASPIKQRGAVSAGLETANSPIKVNIDDILSTTQCIICERPAYGAICESCDNNGAASMANFGFMIRKAEERLVHAQLICGSCTGSATAEPIECESTDCPWFYARQGANHDIEMVPLYQELTKQLGEEIEESLSREGSPPSSESSSTE